MNRNRDYEIAAKTYLLTALRQHKHNDGSEELIPAYDYEETIKLVANLLYELEIK